MYIPKRPLGLKMRCNDFPRELDLSLLKSSGRSSSRRKSLQLIFNGSGRHFSADPVVSIVQLATWLDRCNDATKKKSSPQKLPKSLPNPPRTIPKAFPNAFGNARESSRHPDPATLCIQQTRNIKKSVYMYMIVHNMTA